MTKLNIVDIEKHVEFWRKGAREDWSAARSLIDKAHYRHGLFFVHLSIEKTIKAVVVEKTGEMPPKSHDLLRLAALANLTLDEDQQIGLAHIVRYCAEGRYPDSWGKAPDKAEAQAVVAKAEEIATWLKKTLEKK